MQAFPDDGGYGFPCPGGGKGMAFSGEGRFGNFNVQRDRAAFRHAADGAAAGLSRAAAGFCPPSMAREPR